MAWIAELPSGVSRRAEPIRPLFGDSRFIFDPQHRLDDPL
jgi:hypothetical protein